MLPMRKKYFALFIIVSTLSLLPSCSKQKKAKDGTEFIFVCPILKNEYWEACVKGIARADLELGTHTKTIGPEDATHFPVEMVRYMSQAVEENPDGIMAYAGLDTLNPFIEKLNKEKIPFIAIDSDTKKEMREAYVGTDSYDLGYKAGEAMVKYTNGKGKLGLLVSSLSAEKEMLVLDAFKDAILDYDYEFIAVDETDADPNVAEIKTEAMLEAHPEITAMFNTAGYNVTGAARVKQKKNLDIVLIGFDDVVENLEFIRQGVINAIIAQDPEQMGYRGVYVLKELVDKGSLPKENYQTPTILITKENVDSYKK